MPMNNVERQLKIMHACEKGATGVYYGHRILALIFYKDLISDLDLMQQHEIEHYYIFREHIFRRKSASVLFPTLWCGAGIVYGLFVALFGRNAIWVSTATIEKVVDEEMSIAIESLINDAPELSEVISRIQSEEQSHQNIAENNAKFNGTLAQSVAALSKICSYSAKYLSIWL